MSDSGEPQEQEPPFRPFTLGRFHVLSPLGSGGMARVFLAEYRGVGGFARRVVIKQIHEQHASTERFVKMFVDEANIAARLAHPNVIQVLDLQQEGQDLFMVLEYVDGPDLNTLFNHLASAGKRLPVAVALYVCNQMLAGLNHAHGATALDGTPLGLIHRDITPGNVLLGRQGQVKLSDFGVARAANRMTQTVVGEVKGKYSYMAPEVMQGDPYDQRSDVFGAGVVLWESLTTRPLFRAKSDFHVMEQVLRGQLYPPSAYNPDVPRELDTVVMRALERPVDRRWQSAREMKRALAPFLRNTDQDHALDLLTDMVARHAAPQPGSPPAAQVTPSKTAATPPPAAPQAPAVAARASVPTPPPPQAAAPSAQPARGPPARSQSSAVLMAASASVVDAWAGESLSPSEAELAWVVAPQQGEAGLHATVGAQRRAVGPMSTASAFHLLQHRDANTTDRLGLSPSTLLAVPEAGRLLMLDHLVKPPGSSGPPGMSGAVREERAARLLFALGSQRATGALWLQGTQHLAVAFIQEGCLQYTFQADPTHHLLSLFVQHQPNGRALLPVILQAVLRERLSLPRVMAKVAQLSGSRITAAVAALARERLVHALADEAAAFSFYAGMVVPYELPPSRDGLLPLLPQMLPRLLPARELSAQAARLLERPLHLEALDDRVAAELGIPRDLEVLRQATGSSVPLKSQWARLVTAGTPEEQRLLMTLVLLSQCGLVAERAPAVMVNL